MELPEKGFDVEDNGYQPPAKDGTNIKININPDSNRLLLLEPFPAWDKKNIIGAKLLIKASGKCTTDHISMAGPWLKYRGHLDNISNNCFYSLYYQLLFLNYGGLFHQPLITADFFISRKFLRRTFLPAVVPGRFYSLFTAFQLTYYLSKVKPA